MPTKTIPVYQRGALPGIAGILSPGIYDVDYESRTATPVVVQIEQQQEQPPTDQTPPDQTDTPSDDTQSES